MITQSPLQNGFVERCSFNPSCIPNQAKLQSPSSIVFNPSWSHGTSAALGSTQINDGVSHYWEFHGAQFFGTSVMFGIGTDKAKLRHHGYIDLIGIDNQSWGLSYFGHLSHGGVKTSNYCQKFGAEENVVVGMFFNHEEGTLSYFIDGIYQGIAFTNLNKIDHPLYAMASASAACIDISIANCRKSRMTLQQLCRTKIARELGGLGAINVISDDHLLPTTEIHQLRKLVS